MMDLLARFADLRRNDPARPLIHLPGLGAAWTAAEIRGLAERFAAAAVVTPGAMTPADWRPRQYPGAAVLKLTSGSTGAPKATLTSEAQVVADATHIIAAMGIRPSDTQIAAIP